MSCLPAGPLSDLVAKDHLSAELSRFATEQGNGTWCEGQPVNIRTGRWLLTRGSWCLFYDYQTSSWQQSSSGGEGYVQINGEAVRVRIGQEIRLRHGDTLVVATRGGEDVFRCRMKWNRA